MIKHFFPIWLPIIFFISCGEGSSVKDPLTEMSPSKRVKTGDNFGSVGYIQGWSTCSGVIMEHGLFATAKHCFQADSLKEELTISFFASSQSGNEVRIEGNEIDGIFPDSNTNDILYITYDPAITEGFIELDHSDINWVDPIKVDTSVMMVGYPRLTTDEIIRFKSDQCVAMDRFSLMPIVLREQYQGLLRQTNCEVWYGNSGGPVYQIDESTLVVTLIGIVSHTFEVDLNGEVLSSEISRDQHGDFAKHSNYSPFTEANRDFLRSLLPSQ